MKTFKAFFNIFTVVFLVLSIWSLTTSINEKNEWKHLEEKGVLVEATIVDVIDEYDSPDNYTYAFFEYNYKSKTYTHKEKNYRDGLTIGKTISAYIYPDNPEELFVYDGSTSFFFFWFMLGFALVSTFPGWLLVFNRFRHNA